MLQKKTAFIYYLPKEIELWEVVKPLTVGDFVNGYSKILKERILVGVTVTRKEAFIAFSFSGDSVSFDEELNKFETDLIVTPLGIKDYLTKLSKIKNTYLRFGDKMDVFNYYTLESGGLSLEYLEDTPLSPSVLPETPFPEKLDPLSWD